MQRKAVKLVGLVLIGAAAFSAVRRWLHRSDGDRPDPPVEPPPLVSVPDLEPAPTPASRPEPAPSVERQIESEVVSEPEPETVPEPVSVAEDSEQRWRPPVGEGCPPGYPIKVNERSGIYHVPDGLSYERTRPTRCYADEAAAEADGFRRAKR